MARVALNVILPAPRSAANNPLLAARIRDAYLETHPQDKKIKNYKQLQDALAVPFIKMVAPKLGLDARQTALAALIASSAVVTNRDCAIVMPTALNKSCNSTGLSQPSPRASACSTMAFASST